MLRSIGRHLSLLFCQFSGVGNCGVREDRIANARMYDDFSYAVLTSRYRSEARYGLQSVRACLAASAFLE